MYNTTPDTNIYESSNHPVRGRLRYDIAMGVVFSAIVILTTVKACQNANKESDSRQIDGQLEQAVSD